MTNTLRTDYRQCSGCKYRTYMEVAAEYKEVKTQYVEGRGNLNHGNWFVILICPKCEKAEVRIRYYHEGLAEHEWHYEYKTISPSRNSVKWKGKHPSPILGRRV